MTDQLLAGRYRLEAQIATGGMAAVWRARDELLERPVAVKLLNDALAADAVAAERFRREALTAASISHPNMANVFDYVEEHGRPGIVMELVECETLAQRLARGPMPVAEAVGIADLVLTALESAHRAGIVHRDVKPGNILLTHDGGVKVADFGIARTKGDSSLTMTGTVMGTAHYSAPEQVRGEAATAVSDVYSFGVVLYEMLTGRRPFTGDTAIAVAMSRLSEDPPPPASIRPDLPARLDAVVMRALARDPDGRFPSAAAMRAALSVPHRPPADRTEVMTLGPADDTIALGAARTDTPGPRTPQRHPVGDAVPPRWARRRLVAWILPAGIVALLVFWIFASTAGPTTTTVPDFEGSSIEEARALAVRSGLGVTSESVDSSRRKGTVVDQSVAAGSEVEEGTAITFEVSDGTPSCCRVPDVVRMSYGEAQRAIDGANLDVGEIRVVATRESPPGTVIEQDPSSGYLRPGGDIDITVAKEPERRKGKGRNGDDDD